MKRENKKIKAKEFDRVFDQGSVSEYLDLKSAKADFPLQRINIDIPQGILERVDREATRVGVTRTSLIKLWIAEHADQLAG